MRRCGRTPQCSPAKRRLSSDLMSYIRQSQTVLEWPPCPPSPAAQPSRHTLVQPAVPADQALILRACDAGEWKPGEAIPSEIELAARFKVSQGTVRKAIDELAAENLVVRRQGKGTFVATHAEERDQFRFLRLAPDDGSAERLARAFLDCKRMRAPAPRWRRRWTCRPARRAAGAPAAVLPRRAGGAGRPVAAAGAVQGPDRAAAVGLRRAAVRPVREANSACA